jgi:hypothetical protein
MYGEQVLVIPLRPTTQFDVMLGKNVGERPFSAPQNVLVPSILSTEGMEWKLGCAFDKRQRKRPHASCSKLE